MTVKPLLAACIAALTATPALAQSTSGQALNLKLAPQDLPAPARNARDASSSVHGSASQTSQGPKPGVYYGDTSGRPAGGRVVTCDDAAYNKARVRGHVGMGVVAGNHVSGNYQSGSVRIAKAFGSCEHPAGSMSLSVGAERESVDGSYWRQH